MYYPRYWAISSPTLRLAVGDAEFRLWRNVGTVGTKMPGYVYILRSIKTKHYYIGCTENIQLRFSQHNSSNVRSTKNRRPYNLVFFQEYPSLLIAKKIERKIKNWKRKDFVEKIIADKTIKIKIF